MPTRGSPLRPLLGGRDRRSIAGVSQVLAAVRSDPRLMAELAGLTNDGDWLVAMRALDAFEKLARTSPTLVGPHRDLLIGSLAEDEHWEIRLQIVRALPQFDWPPGKRRRAIAILQDNLNHAQAFVRAWAVDGFALFAEREPALNPALEIALRGLEMSGRKALMARAAKIRLRLDQNSM
jgi:hypothetical protein